MDRATISCPNRRIEVEWSAGASGRWRLPECLTRCAPFAVADLNGDGAAELLIWFEDPTPRGTGGFVEVFDMNASEAAGTALVPINGSESFGDLSKGRFAIGRSVNRSAALACGDPGLIWSVASRQANGWHVSESAIEIKTSLNDAARGLGIGSPSSSEQAHPPVQPVKLCEAPVLIDVG